MNAKQCDLRAAECAAKAADAPGEPIALEFLKLAAQWRAMAVRENFLGQLGDAALAPTSAALLASELGSTARANIIE
jgi:hypothetical protein